MLKRIPRKSVERFILRRKLKNTVGFLRYIATPRGARIFADYAKLTIPAMDRRFLFHGSQRFNLRLTPSHRKKNFYATDDPNYAIFLGVLNLKDANAGVHFKGKGIKLTIGIDFVNGSSSLRKGWVHVVAGHNFKKTSNHEYISSRPIDALITIPVLPTDLTTPITLEVG